MKHEDWDVRKTAVDTLAQMAEKGDEHTIVATSRRLEDKDEDVRQTAVDDAPSKVQALNC